MNYETDYLEDSDGDDDYNRLPNASSVHPSDYDTSPTDSNPASNEVTPTTYTHSGASHPSPRGLITQWNADQCADYIASLGADYEDYADTFVVEEINGEALVAIQHEELKEMGVSSLGHRLTILKGVYDIKVKQNVPIEPGQYVPLSADANAPDAHASQDDVSRIMYKLKLSEDRLVTAETELRTMKDELSRVCEESKRLREDTLPVILMAKNKVPLPQPNESMADPLPSPHGTVHQVEIKPADGPSRSLSRKLSTKKFFLGGGSSSKIPSPTIREGSGLDPAMTSSHMTSLNSQPSSYINSSQPSPTSPPYNLTATRFPRTDGPLPNRHPTSADDNNWPYPTNSLASDPRDRYNTVAGPPPYGRSITAPAGPLPPPPTSNNPLPNTKEKQDQPLSASDTSAWAQQQQADASASTSNLSSYTTTAASSAAAAGAGSDVLKSFRVSMEEPCHKVLPVALKKYHINDDWRQYSLYIVHGDQERCLGLDERPLILFKQLAGEGKKPMFMLRKHAAPVVGFARGRDVGPGLGGAGVGAGGVGGAADPRGYDSGIGMGPGMGVGMPGMGMGSRVQSYAANVPGGEL